MRSNIIWILAGFCLVVFSCKSKKNLSNAATIKVDFDNKKEVIKTINSQKQDFKYLTLQADASYSGPGNSLGFNLNILMKRNDTIWASATAILGIEALRILATKDSVFILNRLQRTYSSNSLQFFDNIIGRPVTINQIQDILIGNSIFDNKTNSAYKQEENTVNFTHTEAGFNIIENYFKSTMRPNSINANNAREQQNILLKYNEYKTQNIHTYPYLINIEAKNKGELHKVDLKLKNIDTTKILSFPFSIPKSYDKD